MVTRLRKYGLLAIVAGAAFFLFLDFSTQGPQTEQVFLVPLSSVATSNTSVDSSAFADVLNTGNNSVEIPIAAASADWIELAFHDFSAKKPKVEKVALVVSWSGMKITETPTQIPPEGNLTNETIGEQNITVSEPTPEANQTAEPSPQENVTQATPTPQDNVTGTPSPTATLEPTPEPGNETVSPTPTIESTPSPTPESTPEPTPTLEATPEPTVEATPEGTIQVQIGSSRNSLLFVEGIVADVFAWTGTEYREACTGATVPNESAGFECDVTGFAESGSVAIKIVFTSDSDAVVRFYSANLVVTEKPEPVKPRVRRNFAVRNAAGSAVAAKVFLYDPASGLLEDAFEGVNASGEIEGTSRDVEVRFDAGPVKRVRFNGLDLSKDFSLGVSDVSADKIPGKTIAKAYAIDPSQLSFASSVFTATAIGTELYKCKDWVFESETCPSDWVKVRDLTPGEDYLVPLGPNDPAFYETGFFTPATACKAYTTAAASTSNSTAVYCTINFTFTPGFDSGFLNNVTYNLTKIAAKNADITFKAAVAQNATGAVTVLTYNGNGLNVAVGDTVVVAVSYRNSANGVTSINDSIGNTFVKINRAAGLSTGGGELWFAISSNGSNTADNVTVTTNTSQGMAFAVSLYSGVASNGSNNASITTAAPAMGTLLQATTVSNAWIVGGLSHHSSGAQTAAKGNQRATILANPTGNTNDVSVGAYDNNSASAATLNLSATSTGGNDWAMGSIELQPGTDPTAENHSGFLDRDTTPANGNEALVGFNTTLSTTTQVFQSSKTLAATDGFNSTNCPTFSSGFCVWNANITASVTCGTGPCTSNTTLTNTTYNFTLLDTTPPKWFDQSQNNSNPAQGAALKLSVRWTDTINLSTAILSTNETGAFVNYSGTYGSILAISGTANTSNFTWSNSSVTGGTVVGWRVYANDSSNNFNTTDTMTFTIATGDTTQPKWFNQAQNKTSSIVPGDAIKFSTNWTDNVNLSSYIFSWNQSGSFVNDTPVSFSGLSDWSNITKTIISADQGKIIGWRIYANDSSNNLNSTDVNTFSVNDVDAPQWSNPQKNASNINQNTTVKFNATWTDNINLSGYIFSINQTGSFANSTFTQFTGTTNTSENTTTITAPVGTTIQWRFYANDSSNNYNATAVQSFTVVDTIPPRFSQQSQNTSEAAPGEAIKLSAYWTDEINLSTAIFSTNETGAFVNYSNTYGSYFLFNSPSNYSNFTWVNSSVPEGTVVGWRIYANDSSNNFNATPVMVFRIRDVTPPKFFGQAQNNSNPNEGETVKLSVLWTDNVNLSTAILSTNETGTFVNYSSAYGSQLSFSGTSNFSNFTWQNSSVPASTLVAWLVYANDSTGNVNVTPVVTFKVNSAPKWFNQTQNKTSNIVPGDQILFTVNWTDDVSLNSFIFSWNQTDNFANDTSVTMTGTINQSNMTKTIVSADQGKVIGWRIYANDSLNAFNATNVMAFRVNDVTPPKFFTVTQNTSTPGTGQAVKLSANWTDNINLSTAILSTNESGSFVNYSNTYGSYFQFNSPSNYSNFTWANASVPEGTVVGWLIYANDTDGNVNATPVQAFRISDGTVPKFFDQAQNESNPIAGESVKLFVRWTDNVNLSTAVISTNETGSFVNYSGAYSSPFALNGTNDYSNFTWQNSSVPASTLVAWLVYANDSTSNVNVTPVMTFKVNSAPKWFNQTQNQTNASPGQQIKFTVNWTDDIALSSYIFSWNQSTSFTNDTATAFSGTANTSTVTKLVATTDQGKAIAWRIYANDSRNQFNATGTMTFTVNDVDPPKWQNQGQNKTSNIITNDQIKFFTNWTDNINLSAYIFSWNQSGSFVNDTPVAFSGLSEWSNITKTIVSADEGRIIGWRIYANDSSNNWNVTDMTAFSVNDTTPPKWSNQGQNASSVIQGHAIKLSALWTDNVNLSTAILSTNETGAFVNHTTYGSPRTFTNQTDWSNFTWSNSSVAMGTVVGWKVYANDTSNNWNVTDVMAFSILDTEPPKWFNQTENNSEPAPGESVKLSAFWTDNINLSTAILSTNESGSFVNYSGTYGSHFLFNSPSNYSNFTWINASVPEGTVVGWLVYANDTAGNVNATPLQTFRIRDVSPPKFFNVAQNTSTPTPGDAVKLSTLWTDNINLSTAVLSTNETGAFVNYSGVYNSPFSFNSPSNYSNFTWINSSVPAGTVVGWRVYANDSSNNLNATPVMIFSVVAETQAPKWFNQGQNKTSSIVPGDAIKFFTNWTDNVNLSSYIFSWNQSGSFANDTSVSLTGTSNQSNVTKTITSADQGKAIGWRIYANDSINQFNATSVMAFTVNDVDSPHWSNQGQNASSIIQGQAVKLSVLWTDNVNLSTAILSTNETGAFVNQTAYGSPRAFTNQTDWSNFTWSNSSVTNGTVVGWRVYANDTSGNVNVTDTLTFTILPPGADIEPPKWFNQAQNKTSSIVPGDLLKFTVNWTDNVNLSAFIFSWNQSGSFVNDSAVAFTGTTNQSNVTKTITTADQNKVIGWRVYANDSSNNLNVTDIMAFAVSDVESPKFFDQAQNESNPGQGDAVKLSVRWTDNSTLHTAVLSTNETGTFVNHLARYGSPFALSGSTDWSNFTWQNASFTPGTVIGWRIYANDTSSNQNATSDFTFTVRDNQPPKWFNQAQNKTTGIVPGDAIKFSTNWTDNVNLSSYIFSWNQSGSFVNDTPVAFSGLSDWSNITKTIVSADQGKTIAWRIYSNDTSNNRNSTSIMTFTVNDIDSPIFSNQGQNTSAPGQGEAVKLSALWTDNVALATAILSTNESGAFVNYSGTYGSPLSITGTSNYSNFTWLNASIAPGTVVGWLVYANDSSGNLNATPVLSFSVSNVTVAPSPTPGPALVPEASPTPLPSPEATPTPGPLPEGIVVTTYPAQESGFTSVIDGVVYSIDFSRELEVRSETFSPTVYYSTIIMSVKNTGNRSMWNVALTETIPPAVGTPSEFNFSIPPVGIQGASVTLLIGRLDAGEAANISYVAKKLIPFALMEQYADPVIKFSPVEPQAAEAPIIFPTITRPVAAAATELFLRKVLRVASVVLVLIGIYLLVTSREVVKARVRRYAGRIREKASRLKARALHHAGKERERVSRLKRRLARKP